MGTCFVLVFYTIHCIFCIFLHKYNIIIMHMPNGDYSSIVMIGIGWLAALCEHAH